MRHIPNDASVPRDKYVWMAHAIKGACGTEGLDDGRDIFVEWAAKYPDAEEDEDTRVFDTINWSAIRTGWADLCRTGTQYGYELPPDHPDRAENVFGVVDPRSAVVTATPHGLQLIPICDLLARPRTAVPWVVDGLLPASGASLLAAKPKAGKSTLARSLAVAVAKGMPWLGLETTRGRVLYLSHEDPDDLVQEEFKRLGADGPDLLVHLGPAPGDAVAQLGKAAEESRPALIVVDTLQRLLRIKDINDYAEVTQKLEPILAIARHTGAHILLIHHSPKGDRDDVADSALGSTALFGSVDVGLFLVRKKDRRHLSSLQRRGHDLPPTLIELDPETHWPIAGKTLGELRSDDAEDAIEAVLDGSHPLKEEEIKEAAGIQVGVFRRALRQLVSRGRLTRTGGGKKGNPFLYALAPEEFTTSPEETATATEQPALVAPAHLAAAA